MPSFGFLHFTSLFFLFLFFHAHFFPQWVSLFSTLSYFALSFRLACMHVFPQVGGVVETNRPDTKNAQYQACIKQGDLLLNRVQKLGRVVDA